MVGLEGRSVGEEECLVKIVQSINRNVRSRV